MKIILKIAQAELRHLFYSPIAWFVILIFYLFGAMAFIFPIESASVAQEVFLESNPDWFGFDNGIGRFILSGVLGTMLTNFYMFIPLLTMAIINREVNSGSIKLLHSSPIRSRDIIIGKYAGIVLFNLVLVSIIGFFLFTGYLTIKDAEYKWYFSMMLGVLLLINAYSAIGMFISGLTNYPIVAAVITFALFLTLSMVNGLWQQYDIVRDVMYFLSMAGKAEPMIKGLLTSRDIAYFLLIILLFLGFTIIKLRSTQESKPWTTSLFRYIALFIGILFIGYFTSMPGKVAYWDLTDNKSNTVHPNTQAVLKELDGSKLTVTLYANLFSERVSKVLPANRNEYLWTFWEPYRRFYPNIEFKYEYFYDIRKGDSTLYRRYPGQPLEEIVDLESEVLGVSPTIFQIPEEIRSKIDLTDELHAAVMVLEYKGRSAFLRTYGDGDYWPYESHVSGTIKRLVREKEPRIAFVTGHYERDIYSWTPTNYTGDLTLKGRGSLLNYGVDTDTINLLNTDIPADLAALVLADPKVELQSIEREKIQAYINNGGDMIILGEPGKQIMLQSITNSIGITLENGTIVKPNSHDLPHKFSLPLTKEGNALADEKAMERFRKYGIGGGAWAEVFGSLALAVDSLNGFKIEPIVAIKGDKHTWIENGWLVVDSAAPVFSMSEGDIQKNNYVTAIKMTRQINNKEQRIIISGDADILSDGRRNSSLGVSFYSWVLQNEYPKYTNFPPSPDRYLSIKSATANILVYVYIYLIPAIILLTAIFLLARRRRK